MGGIVKQFLELLSRLSEDTVLYIAIIIAVCFIAHIGRQIYKEYVSSLGLKRAMGIIEKSIDKSFKVIHSDMERLAKSIDDLIARI